MSESKKLADHQQAVSAYLDDMLLDEATPQSLTLPELNTQLVIETVEEPSKVDEDTWRESPFQTLLFDIQGLQLAIPLHELNGILTWPEKPLTKMPGKASWHIGLYSQEHQHTQVINTGDIILPDNYKDNDSKSGFIILIDNGRWGLACNKVNEVVTLSPEEIRWRQQPGNRPWLAGTVLEKMCSILNIEELVKILEA